MIIDSFNIIKTECSGRVGILSDQDSMIKSLDNFSPKLS